MSVTVELTEEQRQATVLALAHLSIKRPGWDTFLRGIVVQMDNPGLPMYEGFKETGVSEVPREGLDEPEGLARSLQGANEAISRSDAAIFKLTCSCGWWTWEDRPYVHKRIRQHFDWSDVTDGEQVTTTPKIVEV